MLQQLRPPWLTLCSGRDSQQPKAEQLGARKYAITGCGLKGGVEEVARVVAAREGHLFLGSPPLQTTRGPVAAANDGLLGGFTGLSWPLGLGSGGEPFPGAGHMDSGAANQKPSFPHGEIGSHSSGSEPVPAVETLTLLLRPSQGAHSGAAQCWRNSPKKP